MEIFVHDTAFIIAYYRSQQSDLSLDPYAKLWLRPGLHTWADQFAENVTPYDCQLHCLRNRFFYTELAKLWPEEERILFLNLGAGFSMYPYVLSEKVESIELDFEEIAQYKSLHTQKFTAEGLLPSRKVQHWNSDITDPKDQVKLKEKLAPYTQYKKVILIEGVFFFLTRQQIETVISFCSSLMNPKDLLMCVSFQDQQKDTDVFKRLTQYFDEVLKSENNPFTTLPDSFYSGQENFNLIKQSSSWSLGQELNTLSNHLLEVAVLNEHFYILERT